MRITQQRKVQADCSKADLLSRANQWASKYDFIARTHTEDQMLFVRGSLWNAIYTFDVRKLPTHVTLTLSGENPVEVDCVFEVKSLLTLKTPGDERRVSEQFDLLTGALTIA